MVSAFNPFNSLGAGAHFGFGFGLHSIVPVMTTLSFVIVFVGIFVTIIKGIGQWNKNNHSPRLTVPATIITTDNNNIVNLFFSEKSIILFNIVGHF